MYVLQCMYNSQDFFHSNNNTTTLYYTIQNGLTTILTLLMSSFIFGQDGFTPLSMSACNGHYEVVALLCQRGANIEAHEKVSMRSYLVYVRHV